MSTGTYKASPIDMLRSNTRMICAVGPADFGGIDRIRERLRRLAFAGPAARLGLRVDPDSRHWAYEPDSVCDDVVAIEPIDRSDIAEQLKALSAAPSTRTFRARLGGDYLLLDISHGLSDAVLPIGIFAFLADPAPHPELPAWATARAVRDPLPRALAGWAVRNPRTVFDLVYGKVNPTTLPDRASRRNAAAVDTVPWTRSSSVVFASSPEGTPSRLRHWRDSHCSELSVSSLLCAAVASALNATGVPTAQSADFVFDCRRYLGGKAAVTGNFAFGIDFPLLDPTSPSAVHREVSRAVAQGRPLAAGALSTASYLRTRTALPPISATHAYIEADAKLLFSDVGHARPLNAIAWLADPSQCGFFALSESSVPHSIVVTSMQIRDTFHVSASFHDNIFDADTVRSALELAMSDPNVTLSARASGRQEMSR